MIFGAGLVFGGSSCTVLLARLLKAFNIEIIFIIRIGNQLHFIGNKFQTQLQKVIIIIIMLKFIRWINKGKPIS